MAYTAPAATPSRPDKTATRRRSSKRHAVGPSRIIGQRWFTPYLFLLPGIAMFASMFIWPAALAAQLAFFDYNIVQSAEFVGLGNFERLLSDARFHRALVNSGLFILMFIPLSVVLPLFLAILVNTPLRRIQVFRVVYYLPVVSSMVAVAVAWRYVLSRQGVVNWLLSLVGIEPIQFLLNTNWALPTVVIIEGWKNMGLFMMIYLAALQGVPQELVDAAKVDGAGFLRRVRSVVVPAILPFIAVTLTLGMLEAMRSFESIYMLTRGGPQDASLTLGYYIWHLAFERYAMGYASAVGLVLWAGMIGLALLNLRITRSRS